MEKLLSNIRFPVGYFRENKVPDAVISLLSFLLTITIFAYDIPSWFLRYLRQIPIFTFLPELVQGIYPDKPLSPSIAFIATFLLLWYVLLKLYNTISCLYLRRGLMKQPLLRSGWLIEGASQISDGQIILHHSWAGMILKRPIYKDFQISFDFRARLPEIESTVGIIFRAQDLDNYLMIQLSNTKNGTLDIRPHARIRGLFSSTTVPSPKVRLNKKDNHIHLTVQGERVGIVVNNRNLCEFDLPDFVQLQEREGDYGGNVLNLNRPLTVKNIDFLNAQGRIGFRASGNEGGIITNLVTDRL